MIKHAPALIASLAAAAFLAMSGCSSTASPISAHCTLMVETGLLSGLNVGDAYPDMTDGSQVTVTNSSGSVIGTGTLSYDKVKTFEFVLEASAKMGQDASTIAAALSDDVAIYDFTVTGLPGGLQRYGFPVGKNRGTIWVPESQAKDPGLTLGSLSS